MARGVSFIVTPVAVSISATYRKASRFINDVSVVASGWGSALVGVYDTAAYYTSSVVESALAELRALTAKTITAPGNAGAIPVTRYGTVPIVTAGAETRTLAIPTFVNQRLVLYMKTDGGDCVVTVASAINQAGNNMITLNDAGDSIQMRGASTGAAVDWRVYYNNGASLS